MIKSLLFLVKHHYKNRLLHPRHPYMFSFQLLYYFLFVKLVGAAGLAPYLPLPIRQFLTRGGLRAADVVLPICSA